jgi:Fe-S-cluster containining protein
MTFLMKPLFENKRRYLPFLDQLKTLFREMDRTYDNVADQYGFHCTGCVDNCCYTRFYHHTLLELLYLKEGLAELDSGQRDAVQQRAVDVCEKMVAADRKGERTRILCPLNRAGLCIAYAYRPMICRLHGLPHELHRPDGQLLKNPGCDAFLEQCQSRGKTEYISFDRTPFYRRMAMLENELRTALGTAEKIKLTIAEMIVHYTGEKDEID